MNCRARDFDSYHLSLYSHAVRLIQLQNQKGVDDPVKFGNKLFFYILKRLFSTLYFSWRHTIIKNKATGLPTLYA